MSSIEATADVGVKSVLIAYDFSEASHKPLHHALAIARHYGAKFYLVHVVSHIGYTIAGPEALNLAFEKTQRDARQLEKELRESGAHIRQKQVDLVVIGTHGREGLGKLLLGTASDIYAVLYRNLYGK